jgi:enoyl-CoA hydratase
MADLKYVLIEPRADLAIITVNRPDKLNALNEDVVRELRSAFEWARADDAVHGVILTGSGEKAFVAGADIGELAKMTSLTGVGVSRAGQETFRLIETLSKPVVAAVNGFALGGGLELALACHIRVASDNAKLGLPEEKLGIIPGYGGTVRIPRLIGRGRALEMILTGEMIEAHEALRLGLVNHVVTSAELPAFAEELLRKIIANGPVAVALAIQAVDNSFNCTTEDALRSEANMFGLLASTADMREGMNAFLEKRRAKFKGA